MLNNIVIEFIEDEPEQFDWNSVKDSSWELIALYYAGQHQGTKYLDPEAIRCHETGYSPSDIVLKGRYWADCHLSEMDGPARYIDWKSMELAS